MHCQNVGPTIVQDFNGLPVFKVEPMTQTDQKKLINLVNKYVDSSSKLKQLENALESNESDILQLQEMKKQLEGQAAVQARIDRIAAQTKLANSKQLKEESDQKLRQLDVKEAAAQSKLQASTRRVIISELKKATNLTDEQLSFVNPALLDQIKTNKAKRCLIIDNAAMNNVLIPLLLKFAEVEINLTVFKGEVSEEAIKAYSDHVASTKK